MRLCLSRTFHLLSEGMSASSPERLSWLMLSKYDTTRHAHGRSTLRAEPAPLLLQGIELKEAAANPLLGQGHLESGGRFVKAKLTSVAAEGTAVHASSASSGDSFSFPGSQTEAKEKLSRGHDKQSQPGRTAAQTVVADPSPFGSPAVVL